MAAEFNESSGHLKTSRSLVEPSTARTIKALLQDWTTLDRKTKNEMSGGNADTGTRSTS